MEQPKRKISALNVMAIRVQRHANVSKQTTLSCIWMDLTLARSNGAYVGVAEIDFVHEGMNHISNVKVHLKTSSGNVNIDM